MPCCHACLMSCPAAACVCPLSVFSCHVCLMPVLSCLVQKCLALSSRWEEKNEMERGRRLGENTKRKGTKRNRHRPVIPTENCKKQRSAVGRHGNREGRGCVQWRNGVRSKGQEKEWEGREKGWGGAGENTTYTGMERDRRDGMLKESRMQGKGKARWGWCARHVPCMAGTRAGAMPNAVR